MSLFGIVWQPEVIRMNAMGASGMKLVYEDRMNRRLNRPRPTDGYIRYLVPGEDGSEEFHLIYTAPYYVYGGTDVKWKFMKLLYAVLALAGFISAIALLLQPGVLAGVRSVDAAGVFSLLVFAYFLYASFFQLVTPRRMTLYQHWKGVRHFRGALIAATVMTVLSLAATVGYALTARPVLLDSDVTRLVLTAAPVVCTVALLVLEVTRKCPRVPNENALPKGAVQM